MILYWGNKLLKNNFNKKYTINKIADDKTDFTTSMNFT